MQYNIFVLGLDPFNLKQLQTIKNAHRYRFYDLLSYDTLVNPKNYPIEQMIAQGFEQIRQSGVTPDAVINHWDFPSAALVAVFRDAYNLTGASLSSILITENKYWCRLRHQQAIAQNIPAFESIDPFDAEAVANTRLDFPFWLKPVIGFSSQMVYYIDTTERYHMALQDIRQQIWRFGEPFSLLADKTSLPEDIPAHADAYTCIIEKPIGGWQCTVEGYIQNGQISITGIVDSIREGQMGSSFARYEFPSELPGHIQKRLEKITDKAVRALDLDETPFNIEYFWEETTDQIWLLEVNTRISKSHSPLFADVTGASNHEVAIDVALGHKPHYPRKEGKHPVSIKFMLRHYEDAVVTRIPDSDRIRQLENEFEGTRIQIEVHEGQQLSQMQGQEVYSYEVAVIFMGGQSRQELENRYADLLQRLDLQFRPVPSKDE